MRSATIIMGESNFEQKPENKEQPLFEAECLVIPGHSIELVGVGKDKKWKPTRLIQKTNEKGWRTEQRDTALKGDDENAIVGGGNAVTIAAGQYFSDLERAGILPKLVIFAAGRPSYLNEQAPDKPTLNEGRPMLEAFEKETSVSGKLGKDNVVILGENKNTRDDVEKSIELAVSHRLTKIAFLLLELRLDRAEAFWKVIKSERPELAYLDVRFLPAEKFLKEKYKGHPGMFRKILTSFESSKAFLKTNEAEEGGTKAILEKQYKGKGNY